MKTKSKVIVAAVFVALLVIVSLSPVLDTEESDASGTTVHYKEINEPLDFSSTGTPTSKAAESVEKINTVAGSTVCTYSATNNTVTFVQDVSLKSTDPIYSYFITSSDKVTIIINSGVTVNLLAGESFRGTDYYHMLDFGKGMTIDGGGNLNIILKNPQTRYASALLFEFGFSNIIKNISLNIISEEHACIGAYREQGNAVINIQKDANVVLKGKYAVYGGTPNTVQVSVDKEATVKFVGTEMAFYNAAPNITLSTKLYASTSYRATNVEEYNPAKISQYQYISSEYSKTSDLVLPLGILFGLAAIALFYYVFFHPSRVDWAEKEYQEKVAKERAERMAIRAQKLKEADLKRAEEDRKRAEERKIADQKRAELEAQRAEERRIAELKRAEERKIAEQKRAELEAQRAEEKRIANEKRLQLEAQRAEERKLEAERRAAERKAAEERRAEERRLAEERRVAERKAAEERRIALEKQRAEERRLAEERKAAERRAYEERKAAERKAYDDRREAERKAYEERVAAEKRAHEQRVAAERKMHEEKLAAERKAYEERLKEKKQ